MSRLYVQEESTPLGSTVPFGTYGHQHMLLHELSVVQQLMAITGRSCCDSDTGGECRVTKLSIYRTFFQYGELWCPMNPNYPIHYDVSLQDDVDTVVCVPQSALDSCPNTTWGVATKTLGQ